MKIERKKRQDESGLEKIKISIMFGIELALILYTVHFQALNDFVEKM